MADRYWVGGTANWDATAGTKWATTDGGAGGASVPTSADDVFFTAASGAVTVTVSGTIGVCNNLNFTGFTGTFAGANAINMNASLTVGSGMTWTYNSTINAVGTSSATITSNGKALTTSFNISSSAKVLTLNDALSTTGTISVTSGTFTTNNYNVSAGSISSSNSNTRTINLGSSTVTLSGGTAVTFTTSTNLTFNASTSQITCTSASVTFSGGGQTFYNVSFTTTSGTAHGINESNTFNNLTIAGRASAGVCPINVRADQTINGTLTLSAGTNATMRTFVRSDTIGTTRTLTCNAVASLTDIDFRDITIAGSAAPVSGTRLGDCKGNSGITFDAGKTVYWRGGTANWSSSAGWSDSDSTSGSLPFFPLAQDTATFISSPTSGGTVTINAAYNIGTIDMSARTTNTMTLSCAQAPSIYGNWINGTGTTLSGTGTLFFAGRGSQTITSAGKTFTQGFLINTPSGSVTLQDAFTCNRNLSGAFNISAGTFDANGYNFSLTGSSSSVSSTSSSTRIIAFGSGTWTLAGSGSPWNITSIVGLSATGTGLISLTSASDKTFEGANFQEYPTLNQGGTGQLTVRGSNKFTGLTNTAIGRIQFTGLTTNEFTTTFDIDGISGNLLQLGSTNLGQAILIKPTAWLMGANSTDAGNNTGLSFTGGGGLDYLSVSYINGQVSAAPPASNSNFFLMFA